MSRPLLNTQYKPLQRVIGKSKQLQQLNQWVQQYLPEELVPHCHVANFDNGCLTLIVDNSAWATQLRYLLPELLHTLRQQQPCHHVRTIRHLVVPPLIPQATKKRQPHAISLNTKQTLQNSAQHIADNQLRTALLQLVQRL